MAVNVYVYNYFFLLIKYHNRLTKIGKFISNKLSLEKKRIQLQLSLKNRSQNLILNLQNIYYL